MMDTVVLAHAKMPRIFKGSVANGRIEICFNVSPGIELFTMRPYMNKNILNQVLSGLMIVYIMARKGDQGIEEPAEQLLKSLRIAAAELFYLHRRDIGNKGGDNVLSHMIPENDPIQPCTPADNYTCLRLPAGQPINLNTLLGRCNITCKKIDIKSFVVKGCYIRKYERLRMKEVHWIGLWAPALIEPAQ